MVKKTTLKEQFDTSILEHNNVIEIYRELIPKCKPFIEKYEAYFSHIDINYTSISLTPVDSDKIPPMFFCECLEAGIIAKEYTLHSYDFMDTSIVMKLNKC